MKQVGAFSAKIINQMGLPAMAGSPIYIGVENDQHIADEHPEDYKVYRPLLGDILASPGWIVPHPRDTTLQFVKQYGKDFVLVAVRPSKSGRWFVRSFYCMSDEKIDKFNEHDLFTKYRT